MISKCGFCFGAATKVRTTSISVVSTIEETAEGGLYNDEQTMRAMLHTVARLHTFLPVYPSAFVDRKLSLGFFDYYLKVRPRYGLLKVLLSVAVACFPLPYIYAQTVMPYPCFEHRYEIQEQAKNHTYDARLTRLECDSEDYLRDPKNVWHGVFAFVGTLIAAGVLSAIGNRRKAWEYYLLLMVKPVMNRIFYNGMGPWGTHHSSWQIFIRHGCQKQWSYMHDALGTVDYAVISLCLAVVVPTQIVCILFWETRTFKGVSTGLVVGSVIARIVIHLSNIIFGANEALIDAVHMDLKRLNLENLCIDFNRNGAPHTMEDKIHQEKERAVNYLKDQAKKFEKTGHSEKQQSAQALISQVEKHGELKLRQLADYLRRHWSEVVANSDMIYLLYEKCDSRCSISSVGLCAITLLDPTLFLIRFFDPEMCVFGDIWEKDEILTEVHIISPINAICMYENPRWRIFAHKENCDGDHRLTSSGPNSNLVVKAKSLPSFAQLPWEDSEADVQVIAGDSSSIDAPSISEQHRPPHVSLEVQSEVTDVLHVPTGDESGLRETANAAK